MHAFSLRQCIDALDLSQPMRRLCLSERWRAGRGWVAPSTLRVGKAVRSARAEPTVSALDGGAALLAAVTQREEEREEEELAELRAQIKAREELLRERAERGEAERSGAFDSAFESSRRCRLASRCSGMLHAQACLRAEASMTSECPG